MAAPHVAGVVALMLDANPLLTPQQIKQIVAQTATPMPGYQAWEAGAGYVNAYAAVQRAFALR
jgi:serine protease AprX